MCYTFCFQTLLIVLFYFIKATHPHSIVLKNTGKELSRKPGRPLILRYPSRLLQLCKFPSAVPARVDVTQFDFQVESPCTCPPWGAWKPAGKGQEVSKARGGKLVNTQFLIFGEA